MFFFEMAALSHPRGNCRYGNNCTRVDCYFYHPGDNPTVTSDRGDTIFYSCGCVDHYSTLGACAFHEIRGQFAGEVDPSAKKRGSSAKKRGSSAKKGGSSTKKGGSSAKKSKNCRYGDDCYRRDCYFHHPSGDKRRGLNLSAKEVGNQSPICPDCNHNLIEEERGYCCRHYNY